MSEANNFFTDGEAYDRMMGQWSRASGNAFLDWLSLPDGLRWIDVGCGTGAFTELVLERGSPLALSAVDPSAEQIEYAKSRSVAARIDYRVADAQDLPYEADMFDVGAMALVISFIEEPPKAIAELKRVVRGGGTIATYIWDITGGGHSQQPIRDAIKAMGITAAPGRNDDITRRDSLEELFQSAGLLDVASRTIDIRIDYPTFEDYWNSQTGIDNTSVRPIRAMSAEEVERLKTILRERLTADKSGAISYTARCNAIRGIVPD